MMRKSRDTFNMKDCKPDKTNTLDWMANAWSMAVGELSHSLATKMATLQLKQQGLQKVIPGLLKGYHLAVDHHLMEDEISSKLMRRIDDMQNLDEQVTPMFELLEQFNSYCSQLACHNVPEIPCLSAQRCLVQLLADYPYQQDSQRNLIKLELNEDFELKCPPLFIETSLRHLVTAALQRTIKSGHGVVQVWLSNEDDFHAFNIKDTGLSASDEPTNLFNHMLFEPYDTSRPGLGFCKLAMMHMGGDIICDQGDEGTHFKVILPKAHAP